MGQCMPQVRDGYKSVIKGGERDVITPWLMMMSMVVLVFEGVKGKMLFYSTWSFHNSFHPHPEMTTAHFVLLAAQSFITRTGFINEPQCMGSVWGRCIADGAPSVRTASNKVTSAFHQEWGFLMASCILYSMKWPSDSGFYSSRV